MMLETSPIVKHDISEQLQEMQTAYSCPMQLQKQDGSHDNALTNTVSVVSTPRLMRVSEVKRECDINSPLACVLDWVQNFLGNAHPELGRKGPVCPFVPISIEVDTIWMAEVKDAQLSLDSIAQMITVYRDLFLEAEPKSGPEMMNKAFLIVFPNLQDQGAHVVDEVQYKLKRYFVAKGLMLGEFHASNQSPGLRNPEFRPLRSPIPMLAIRYMVDSDLPFLMRADYPAAERAAYLRAYITRLASELSPAKFKEALEAMIEAEIDEHSRQLSSTAQAPLSSNWHCVHCGTENNQVSELV